MIYYECHFLSQDCNSALYCISNLYLHFENDMQFILILPFLSFLLYLFANFFYLHGFYASLGCVPSIVQSYAKSF